MEEEVLLEEEEVQDASKNISYYCIFMKKYIEEHRKTNIIYFIELGIVFKRDEKFLII